MAQLKSDIHDSRNQHLLGDVYDGRIMSANKAKSLGLIDRIAFWSDMPDILREDFKNHRSDIVLTRLDEYQNADSQDYVWSPFNKIAVVEINGSITSGKNRSDVLFGGIQTGSDEIVAIFDSLEKDPFLKGVIIRINSPGVGFGC